MAQSGSAARSPSGPEVELWAWLAIVPGPDVRSGRGELGTGAGLSETYLSTQRHRRPTPGGADTRTRTQDTLRKAL